jgi:hypothetical protein
MDASDLATSVSLKNPETADSLRLHLPALCFHFQMSDRRQTCFAQRGCNP